LTRMKSFVIRPASICALLSLLITVLDAVDVCEVKNTQGALRTIYTLDCSGTQQVSNESYYPDHCAFGVDVMCGIIDNDSFERFNEGWDQDGLWGLIYTELQNANPFPSFYDSSYKNGAYSPDGHYVLIIGDSEENINYANTRIFNTFDWNDTLLNATHLSFQLMIMDPPAEQSELTTIPTLFVSICKSTILTLPIRKEDGYGFWRLINVPLNSIDLSSVAGEKLSVGFRFVYNESVVIGIDTVRFVNYGDADVENEYNYTLLPGECAPRCIKDESIYNPACDNPACDYAFSKWNDWVYPKKVEYLDNPNHSEHPRCYDGFKSGRAVHQGVCSHIFSDNSCCTSVYDENASYNRDGGELEKACNLDQATSHCRHLLDSLRCAPCYSDSLRFTAASGGILICSKFAKEIFEHCSAACPSMKNLDTTSFFSSNNLGLVVDCTRSCYNGEDNTPDSDLLDCEIALIAGVPSFVLVLVLVFLVIFFLKSKKFAETIDDKEETNTCVVAPESTAAPVTASVEMGSMQLNQSMQPNSTTMSMQPMDGMQSQDQQSMMALQQMQMQQMQMQQMQMMMMMNSAAMGNGGLDSQAMMASGNLTSQAPNATSPELNATVVPHQ